jgi:Calx-beta domain/Trypsin
MVTTTEAYSSARYQAVAGQGWDGVVRVSVSGRYGSGVLLFDGRAVLTAAHLFSSVAGMPLVHFETPQGASSVQASGVLLHPLFNPQNLDHDLALVWLPQSAVAEADRYGQYRGDDEIRQVFNMVGYGMLGTGGTGVLASASATPVRLHAANQFDADPAMIKSAVGAAMTWLPSPGKQLVADFDNGSAAHDALGVLLGNLDTGTGLSEGLIAPGDSGGPALIGGLVAGIASYTFGLSVAGADPDIDSFDNSSFGEMGAWQRVSAHQQWIDQAMRSHYADAPKTREDVKLVVEEGDAGAQYAYFLLEFSGLRADPNQWLSVDYETRDGTAFADEDYLAVKGTLILYPGENQAVIPVEILGDQVAETDEVFSLAVYNPVGGTFAYGRTELVATRTILNDDLWP